MSKLWHSLESIPSLAAVEAEWQALLDDDYALFRGTFLADTGKHATSYPCPRDCGCSHKVVRHSDGSIVAVCRCVPPSCDDIKLKSDDTVILQLEIDKLGRAIRKAFGFHSREADPGIYNTLQIAAYTDQSYPVFFSVQHDRQMFKQVVSELAARFQERFILLVPTADFSDGTCKGILTSAKSVMLPLETSLSLIPPGEFKMTRQRDELLAGFSIEQVTQVSDDEVTRLLHVVTVMDDESVIRKPSLMSVFNLYCREGLTTGEIAKKSGCSKSTVINRKRKLEEKLGKSLQTFRAISSHLEDIEDGLSDQQARHIHRKNALR